MARPADILFDEYARLWAAGQRPDALAYVAEAGDEGPLLERMIDDYLRSAPARAPDPAIVRMMEAWIGGEASLLVLRRSRRKKVADVVAALVDRLGLGPQRQARVTMRYQQLEAGLLDVGRVDRRVLDVLADVLGVDVRDVVAWPGRPPGPRAAGTAFARPPGAAFLTPAPDEGGTDIAALAWRSVLRDQPGKEADEVDRLFGVV